MDEQVDIVNDQDEVIGTASKLEAHEKGLLHRTVISEVIDSQGRWVLVRQAGHKQDAGQFVSPVGGHVQSGESIEEALNREALEEIGIKDFGFKPIGKFIFNRETRGRRENHFFIIYHIYSDSTPKLNDESVEYRHFTPEELKKEIKENKNNFGDAFIVILEKLHPEILV